MKWIGLCLMIMVRMACLAAFWHHHAFDEIPYYDYGQLAWQIRQGVTYGLHWTLLGPDWTVGINPYRPSLYPFVMAPFVQHPLAFLCLQVCLGILMVVMLWRFIAARAGERAANWACLLPAFHWSAIYWAMRLEPDTLFAFLVVAAIMQMEREYESPSVR